MQKLQCNKSIYEIYWKVKMTGKHRVDADISLIITPFQANGKNVFRYLITSACLCWVSTKICSQANTSNKIDFPFWQPIDQSIIMLFKKDWVMREMNISFHLLCLYCLYLKRFFNKETEEEIIRGKLFWEQISKSPLIWKHVSNPSWQSQKHSLNWS